MKYTKPYVERLSDLAIKGKKAKLQFPTAVRERLIEECGFTLDEKTILNLRAEGKSITEVALKMNCSEETINRRIRSIKDKIAFVVTV